MSIIGGVTSLPDKLSPGFGTLFDKYINVFGINIIAQESVPDIKVEHVANVLAQYLDNDEDGEIDDEKVGDELFRRYASILLFDDQRDADNFFRPSNILVWIEYLNLLVAGAVGNYQELLSSEIIPKSKALDAFHHGEGPRGDSFYDEDEFDKTLEEVLHLITHSGVRHKYEEAFGEGLVAHAAGSGAMSEMNFKIDKLNLDCGSGYWKDYISPSSGECKGWYAIKSEKCTYSCFQRQGLYWALTSLLGAQNYTSRIEEVKEEWTMCEPSLIRRNATELVYLLERHSKYDWLPAKLPNGQYKGELPKAKVKEIKDFAPYIIAACVILVLLLLYFIVWCYRRHKFMHSEHTEEEKEKVIQMKAKSSRNLTRGMSIDQRTGLSIAETGKGSPMKRQSSRTRDSKTTTRDTRTTMDTRGTMGDSMASTKSTTSTMSKADLRKLQRLEEENKRLKKVEEENRKLRERVKEHEELFSGLEEEDVQFEEMDEEAPIPLNQRASEAITR
ncbi:hypothetical protein TrVE_jg12597 [Triparma verrucosa]|uniref:Uncharacterized protein n=1 Tax=Triparma verrucosa TaxID=1606542 RepID=A0A9W7FIX5_9STRA|nr:hypothetical protein TrVE_jg12597 [Triparma verrucosa]